VKNRPLAKALFINLLDGHDAHPTRKNNSCGMGILPVLVIFARGLIKPKHKVIFTFRFPSWFVFPFF
ncbi:hypothetical protein, partial [Microcoleus sp. B4-D1]|uniref:hypothetical protein n=1 Tax=Microcoleus sp. B4-D1 TaxID=2818666 RepID=UPI002FD63B76